MSTLFDPIHQRLFKQPHKIQTYSSVRDAIGTYGYVTSAECVVQLEVKHCIHCKMTVDTIKAKKQYICPVNIDHNFTYDFVDKFFGHGQTIEEAVNSAVTAIDRQ